MKTIRYGLIGCALLMASNAQAASCTVTYKAKKIQVDRFLFQNVKNLKYRSGTLLGNGASKSECKRNALKKLKKGSWQVTFASVKMK